jgi:hypothetical protein
LGKTIEGSGIDEAWVEAEMYSSITVEQIINGNHYRRALEAHEVTLQILFDLWIEAFFSERPTVRTSLEASIEQVSKACVSKQGVRAAHFSLLVTLESLNIEKQLAEFDAATSYVSLGMDVHVPSHDFASIPTSYTPRRLVSTFVIT